MFFGRIKGSWRIFLHFFGRRNLLKITSDKIHSKLFDLICDYDKDYRIFNSDNARMPKYHFYNGNFQVCSHKFEWKDRVSVDRKSTIARSNSTWAYFHMWGYCSDATNRFRVGSLVS